MVEPAGYTPYGPLIETTMRVVTWNVWWRFGPFEERLAAIVATLKRAEPDVVCLQEVYWSDDENLAAAVAEPLGFHHIEAARRAEDGWSFGNAVLSRWPIERTEEMALPAAPEAEEDRLAVMAEVAGPRGRVQVFCTHLNWRFDHSHVRQLQVKALADFVAETRPREFPPVVCGDFNAEPTSDEIRMLTGRAATPVRGLVFHDAWDFAGAGDGHTIDTRVNPFAAAGLTPSRRIDYVFTGWPKRGGAGAVLNAELLGHEAVGGVFGSDHYGVVADLRY